MQKHGPSFLKFNASLVDDANFVTLINDSVPIWFHEFKAVTDKRLLWDLIKYRISHVLIKYSKEKAFKRRKTISDIEAFLKAYEEKCSSCPSPENIENYEILKLEDDGIYDQLSRGAIIRSKAAWYESGEKKNKYFLNLESHKKAKSSVRRIFNKDGIPKTVLNEIGKSVYNSRLANAGIIRLGDLITENNALVTNSRVRELNMSPLDAFNIASLIDALPVQWRQSLRTCMSTINEPFILENYILLSLNGQNVSISKAVSKSIYKEQRDRIITPPTAQFKYNTQFADDELDWRKIYSLPHRVALDTKSREFQYKLLYRCLATNLFLSKISIVASPLCSFCGVMDESLEHIFVSCHYTEKFGQKL